MGTTLDYDRLVEGFRAKISGNISSIKMTEAETAKEIAEITEGVFPTIEDQTFGKWNVEITQAEIDRVTQPKRRGRPKGSKNKPKEQK